MATHPIAIVRSVSLIVNDLATTRQRLSVLQASTIGRDPTDEQDADWTHLERRKDALEAEMDAAIFASTGVSWALLEGVRS